MVQVIPGIHFDSNTIRRRISGGTGEKQSAWLWTLSPDVVKLEDDFLGDAVDGAWGGYNNGTSAASAAVVAGTSNGEITLTTGTDDDGYALFHTGSLQFKGDLMCRMEARVRLSAITTVKLEVGFTDAISSDAGAVNALATPSFTAANAAGWAFDRDDTVYAQAFGVKAGTGITKVEPTSSVATPVADTYVTYGVAIETDAAKYYLKDANGEVAYETAFQADAIEGGTAIVPYIFVQARTGSASRVATVDYIRAWQARA